MELKEFAKLIDGKEYNHPQFTDDEIQTAKDNGFVIVYGASDDLIEFDGALYDEGDCFDGGKIFFDRNGVVSHDSDKKPNVIDVLWDTAKDENGNASAWGYNTEIPHETFKIWEDGELYCIGIVFKIDDVR